MVAVADVALDVQVDEIEATLAAMRLAVDAADETVAIENRQAEIAEAALRCRHVAFDLVVELVYRDVAVALDHGVVERRQQPDTRRRTWHCAGRAAPGNAK